MLALLNLGRVFCVLPRLFLLSAIVRGHAPRLARSSYFQRCLTMRLLAPTTLAPLANRENTNNRNQEKQHFEGTRSAVGRDAKDLFDEVHDASFPGYPRDRRGSLSDMQLTPITSPAQLTHSPAPFWHYSWRCRASRVRYGATFETCSMPRHWSLGAMS